MQEVAHIGLMVRDVDSSADFYQNVLGCQKVNSYQDKNLQILYLKYGDTTIELVQDLKNYQERPDGKIDHIAFVVPNIDQKITELRAKDVSFLSDDPIDINNWRIIFFEGPDKERLELIQM
jgi:lactoylglutathione lyase